MASSYIPLGDVDPSHPHNENASSNHPNAPEITNDTQFGAVKKHTLVLFCKTFVRCLVTFIFIAFVLATMKIYENEGNFASHQKTNFNIIIRILSLGLGLNFFVSHNAVPMPKGVHKVFSLICRDIGLIQRPSKRVTMED